MSAPVTSATSESFEEQSTAAESRRIRRRSLGLLRSLLRPVAGAAWGTAALVVGAQLAAVAGPALVAYGIDQALPALTDGDAGPITLATAAYLAAALLGGVLTAATVRASARVSQTMLLDLRRRVFRHTQRLSLEFHESYTSGRIISRQTSDVDALRELLDGGVTTLASGVLAMVFTAVSLVLLDWRSGLVLLIAVVPGVILTRWFQVRTQVQYRKQRTAAARLIVRFVETMTGIRAVQAFRREPQVREVYGDLAEDYRGSSATSIRLNGVFDTGLTLIGNVTVAAVLLVGGLRALDGGIEVGVLVAAVLYSRRFFNPLQQIGMFYNSFQSATAALEKLASLLAEEPTVPDPERPKRLAEARGDVRFDDVEFGYGTGPTVLPHVDLHIPAGQSIALVGETGAGKSTIAKLLARFYDVRAGAVRLDGLDLREIDPVDLRRAVVMVTQEAYLFSGSIGANIALGKPEATPQEIEAAARAVGVHDLIAAMPDGYDTEADKRGVRLSAGQRQLVSFARAFLADPVLLILDEATSSLDVPGEALVQVGLQTLLADRTSVVIAHRLSTVMGSDRVLVIEDGRIVEDGSPFALVAAGGRFADLHADWQRSLRRTT
ncbi:ABC transporter ATP-binding protein [Cellulomonas humilata]|uniref:ATP-binding cassette subfamily B protein n=1 Tax=Cellulomonas humilata TaxID=144055 RepID=A0ABU0EG61_9CELL|nr:ABC transporter ATP-binding protein [Cellulomonas humilata]MDQ0374266.1 ATP-binding cassette subfamily B protein [Cellulomonas humilata]